MHPVARLSLLSTFLVMPAPAGQITAQPALTSVLGAPGAAGLGNSANLANIAHATSDFGHGGASAINSVAFVRSSVKTVGNQQFITWYGCHQQDPAAAHNNTIWIGRRTLGSSQWETFRHPSFTANTIGDGHDVISYGIDCDGYMHLSWGMTGPENPATYPQFLKKAN